MTLSVILKFVIYFILLFCHSINGLGVIFDFATCSNGCKNPADCPEHSKCVPISDSKTCGICTCLSDYSFINNKCVLISKSENTAGQSKSNQLAAITTQNPPTELPTSGAEFYGDQDTPRLSCADYCNNSSCKNASLYATKPCATNADGKNVCDSGLCFNVQENRNYCICPGDKIGLSCADPKSISCEKSDNKLDDADIQFDRRWRSVGNPDTGSVVGRHFAKDLTDCVRLCKWATPSTCRSINYGPINGRMVCELLNVWATPKSFQFTPSFLHNATDWLYMCCFR